jgi:hypothetical protein
MEVLSDALSLNKMAETADEYHKYFQSVKHVSLVFTFYVTFIRSRENVVQVWPRTPASGPGI